MKNRVMKSAVIVMTALFMTVSLASCKGNAPAPQQASQEQQASPAQGKASCSYYQGDKIVSLPCGGNVK